MYESIMWTYIREEQGLLKNLLKERNEHGAYCF